MWIRSSSSHIFTSYDTIMKKQFNSLWPTYMTARNKRNERKRGKGKKGEKTTLMSLYSPSSWVYTVNTEFFLYSCIMKTCNFRFVRLCIIRLYAEQRRSFIAFGVIWRMINISMFSHIEWSILCSLCVRLKIYECVSFMSYVDFSIDCFVYKTLSEQS